MADPYHSVRNFIPYRMNRQANHQTLADGGPTAFKAMIVKAKAEGLTGKLQYLLTTNYQQFNRHRFFYSTS